MEDRLTQGLTLDEMPGNASNRALMGICAEINFLSD